MSIHDAYLDVVQGRSRGVLAAAARAALSGVEPFYALTIAWRNRKFDAGRGVTSLPRAVVGVGNLTTGGTGKTPMVAHVARTLRAAGHRPAVLMRGYGAAGGESDEAEVYRELLGQTVPVAADPDRVAGAARVLSDRPEVDVFLLDDGFQHRRVARRHDVVLIDATDPFGGGRLLPRGLLREPVTSLARATAVVFTRTDLVDADAVTALEAQVRAFTPAPIHHATFSHDAYTDATGRTAPPPSAGDYVLASGVGNPRALGMQVTGRLGPPARTVTFPDHHRYTARDVAGLTSPRLPVVTTLKDWVKLRSCWPADAQVRVVRQAVRVDPPLDLNLA